MAYIIPSNPFYKPTIEERIETERIMAQQSTYWSCCCGLGHVSGCKVRRTEWIVKGLLGFILGTVIYWKWVH